MKKDALKNNALLIMILLAMLVLMKKPVFPLESYAASVPQNVSLTSYSTGVDGNANAYRDSYIWLRWNTVNSEDTNVEVYCVSNGKKYSALESAGKIKISGMFPGQKVDFKWRTTSLSDTSYISSNWSQTLTFYIPDVYEISFDTNGGGIYPVYYKYEGKALTIPEAPMRNGYIFLGWVGSESATAPTYMPGDKYTKEGNATLYAVWKAGNAEVYNITYDANGGNGAPSAQIKEKGKTLKLSTTKPVRSGYTFVGWSHSKNADIEDYKAGGNYTLNNNTVLYAVWKKNEPPAAPVITSVTSDNPEEIIVRWQRIDDYENASIEVWNRTTGQKNTLAGSATLFAIQNQNAGEPVTISIRVCKKVTDSNGNSNTYYSPYTTTTYTPSTGFYISYNANGGKNAPGTQTEHSSTVKISSQKPTKTDCTFLGWSKSKNATTASYQPGDTISINGNITLYAVWSENASKLDTECTITYDANGGSGAPGSQSFELGKNIYLSKVKPVRSGYSFEGWATSKTASTAQYMSGAYYSTYGNITLYAVWKKDLATYTIRYNANGGEGGPSSQKKTEGESITLSSSKPSRSGYTFKGWATSSSSTTVTYASGSTYSNDKAVTLYAVWYKTSPANKSLSFKNVRFSFSNFSGKAGKSLCKKMYKSRGKNVYKSAYNNGAGGNCFGMASTSGILYAAGVNVKSLDKNKTVLTYKWKDGEKVKLVDMIKGMQVSLGSKENYSYGGNTMAATVDLLVDAATGDLRKNKITVVTLGNGEKVHAVSVIGFKYQNATWDSLIIYDSYYSYTKKAYLNLKKNAYGEYTGVWEYRTGAGDNYKGGSITHSSQKSDPILGYSTYNMYKNVWDKRGKLTSRV